jgi:hypothetical protein
MGELFVSCGGVGGLGWGSAEALAKKLRADVDARIALTSSATGYPVLALPAEYADGWHRDALGTIDRAVALAIAGDPRARPTSRTTARS